MSVNSTPARPRPLILSNAPVEILIVGGRTDAFWMAGGKSVPLFLPTMRQRISRYLYSLAKAVSGAIMRTTLFIDDSVVAQSVRESKSCLNTKNLTQQVSYSCDNILDKMQIAPIVKTHASF